MRLYITGIEAVSKFIDALTTKQADQFIVVRTDEYQSYLSSDKRGFIVEIYDNESHYIEAWDLNDKTYTLDEAKKVLRVDDDYGTKEHPHNMGYDDLGTEENHVRNFFGKSERTCARYELTEEEE